MRQSSLSRLIIDHSPDLQQLLEEGYGVVVRNGHLLIKEVPYLIENREIRRGTIVSVLTLQGHTAARPADHVAWFTGSAPHDHNGNPLNWPSKSNAVMGGENVKFLLSLKPQGGYDNYYDKMKKYEDAISRYAKEIDSNITAKTFNVLEPEDENYPFKYMDNASAHAGIEEFTARLALEDVAIIGLGGTGSYILDLVSKTPVKSIHLFDDDIFGTHNAFRAPGAASIAALSEKPSKSDYYCEVYSKMKNNIFAHGNIEGSNIILLRGMSFVFVAAELGDQKPAVLDELEENHVPFIDAGMDIYAVDDTIDGLLGMTVGTDESRGIVTHARDHPADDEYSSNIQIADLNALNAALAVIKWKKLRGFYRDTQNEFEGRYIIHSNMIVSRGANRD